MTLEEAQLAANHKLPCEFAWLEKDRWCQVEIRSVDFEHEHIIAFAYPFTIEVTGRDEIEKYFRIKIT